MLQTLSILIQNIKSPTAIYYLFSNNYLNEIVCLRFDFNNEEVLGYYINLLKAISMKFNESTIQFFFQACTLLHELNCEIKCNTLLNHWHLQEEKGPNAFPLYTEAVKLLHHPDGLVGAAVRSLTLNVYAAADPAVQRFILSPPASHFFTQLAKSLASAAEVGPDLCHGHAPSSSLFATSDRRLKGYLCRLCIDS